MTSLTDKAKNVATTVDQVPANVVAAGVDEALNLIDLAKGVVDQILDAAKSTGDAGETQINRLGQEIKSHTQNLTGILNELLGFTKSPGGGASA